MTVDLWHEFGGDLRLSATGDLLSVQGGTAGTQRVLRRLLTAAGDYVWHPRYGAGLPAMVGQPTDPRRITAVIRRQIAREARVAATPAPTIEVQADLGGTVSMTVRYADAIDASDQTLLVPGAR